MAPKTKTVATSSGVAAAESRMGGVPPQEVPISEKSLQLVFAIENMKRLCPLNFFFEVSEASFEVRQSI